MADTQKSTLEREYVIPLRSEWNKVVGYKRARKAVIAVKEFIAKHMKVEDRDLDKVRVDLYLNNEIWYRGASNAPNKIKVKAVKDSEGIVRVTLVHLPENIKFAQARHARAHKKEDKKQSKTDVESKDESKEAQTAEEKKDEQEKEQSVAKLNEKIEAQNIKAAKHTSKKSEPRINRMALKK